MALFTYEAVTAEGVIERGSLAAASRDEVAATLRRRHLEPVRLRGGARTRATKHRKLKLRDVAEFTRYVSITCHGGLPIIESIEDFAQQTPAPEMRAVLEEVVRDIRGGTTLSEALARPRVFGEEVLALTQAGEASGAMDAVMRRIAEQLEFELDVRGKVKGALIYPAVLATAVLGLVILLITFLMPRVVGMLVTSGAQLPTPTRLLLGISAFLRSSWPLLVGVVAAAIVGLKLLAASPRGAVALNRVVLALPVLGKLARMGAESRFTSTLRTLLSGGVEAISALEMAAGSCGAPYVAMRTRMAAAELRQGKTFAEVLAGVGLFHPLVLRMVRLGERSGQMDEALKACVDYFAVEVPKAVRKCLALIEPLIICFAGVTVGFVLLATLLPVFSLYEAF